jgi:hypothetical protein
LRILPTIAPYEADGRLRRIPYPPTRTVLLPSPLNTVPPSKLIPYSQTKNTVPASKFVPPVGTDQPIFEPTVKKRPAKAAILAPVDAQQRIPYSPTSVTVPPSKEYRTVQQGIPYRPARNTVLSDKIGARCSRKTGKNCRLIVRASCNCFLFNVLYVVRERGLRVW